MYKKISLKKMISFMLAFVISISMINMPGMEVKANGYDDEMARISEVYGDYRINIANHNIGIENIGRAIESEEYHQYEDDVSDTDTIYALNHLLTKEKYDEYCKDYMMVEYADLTLEHYFKLEKLADKIFKDCVSDKEKVTTLYNFVISDYYKYKYLNDESTFWHNKKDYGLIDNHCLDYTELIFIMCNFVGINCLCTNGRVYNEDLSSIDKDKWQSYNYIYYNDTWNLFNVYDLLFKLEEGNLDKYLNNVEFAKNPEADIYTIEMYTVAYLTPNLTLIHTDKNTPNEWYYDMAIGGTMYDGSYLMEYNDRLGLFDMGTYYTFSNGLPLTYGVVKKLCRTGNYYSWDFQHYPTVDLYYSDNTYISVDDGEPVASTKQDWIDATSQNGRRIMPTYENDSAANYPKAVSDLACSIPDGKHTVHVTLNVEGREFSYNFNIQTTYRIYKPVDLTWDTDFKDGKLYVSLDSEEVVSGFKILYYNTGIVDRSFAEEKIASLKDEDFTLIEIPYEQRHNYLIDTPAYEGYAYLWVCTYNRNNVSGETIKCNKSHATYIHVYPEEEKPQPIETPSVEENKKEEKDDEDTFDENNNILYTVEEGEKQESLKINFIKNDEYAKYDGYYIICEEIAGEDDCIIKKYYAKADSIIIKGLHPDTLYDITVYGYTLDQVTNEKIIDKNTRSYPVKQIIYTENGKKYLMYKDEHYFRTGTEETETPSDVNDNPSTENIDKPSSENTKPTVVGPKGTKISSVKTIKGGFKVSYKKDSKANGYEIRYSTKKSLSGAKKIKVNSKNTTSKTIKGLKSKKTYYVQVRSFTKANGKYKYSSWSAKKSVRIK